MLAAVLLLVALTQTQVGRDQVARQIERQFDREFQGSLSIERLSGNLLWTLYGGSVELRDDRGRTVVRADSIILEPRWSSLFRDRIDLRRVTFIRAEVNLEMEDGRWNLTDALAPRDTLSEPPERSLGLAAPQIRFVDASVRSSNRGPVPEAVRAGQVFDYTNASLVDLNARLDIDIQDHRTRVRVRRLTGYSPSLATGIERLAGRLDILDGSVRYADLNARLTESTARVTYRRHTDDQISVNVGDSHLSASEIRRLIPAYPLHGDVALSAALRGTGDALTIQRSSIRNAGMRLGIGGNVYPGNGHARVDVNASVADVDLPVLARLLGTDPADWPHTHDISGDVGARGTVSWSPGLEFAVELDPDVSTSAGSIQGQIAVAHHRGQWRDVTGNLSLRRVDPSAIYADWPQGSISGRARVDGSLGGSGLPQGRVVLDLSESVIAGRTLSGLAGKLTSRNGLVEGRLRVAGDGAITVAGIVQPDRGTYDVALTLEDLNLQALLPELPVTRLTGRADAVATGTTLDDGRADIVMQLSGSTAHVADSTWHLPEDELRATFRPRGDDEPRLALTTDAVSIVVDGEFEWMPLIESSTFWGGRLAEAVRRDILTSSDPNVLTVAGPLTDPAWADQRLVVDITSHEDHALSPWVASLAPGSAVHLTAELRPRSFEGYLHVDSEQITIGTVSLDRANTQVEVSAVHDQDLLDRLGVTIAARADSTRIGSGRPFATNVAADMQPGSRHLTLDVGAYRPVDSVSVDIAAQVALLGDRYRFSGDIELDAVSERWAARSISVDLQPEAMTFRDFDAVRTWPDNGFVPHIGLQGTASAFATDTLMVSATAIAIEEVFDLLALPLPFDGRADADLLVTSVTRSPAILGSATIDEFYIWGDHAGRLVARSEIISGEDGFFADLRLSPTEAAGEIENDLRLYGNVRFPGRSPDGSRDRGYLDLSASLNRLDLFIFNHLFPDIVEGSRGGAQGYGSIGGDWSNPIFNADLTIADGSTTVPVFNLGLDARGRVTVDQSGIHLRNVALRDKLGGTAAVDGSILFNQYRYFSFDLRGRLDEFEVIDVNRAQAGTLPFYGHIRANGSATLTGPLHDAFLRSADAVTTPDSRIYIPVQATGPTADAGFLLFADEFGRIPEVETRASLIAERPETERPFLDGLQMTLNVDAPSGSTVHLVFDPVIGDVITAVGSGQLQLMIRGDEFLTFGAFEVERGDYLFTAGDVFTRRFDLDRGGTLVWEGDPIDARLDLPASYRTRASLAGLGLTGVNERQRVPLVVNLHVTGQVSGPLVDLSLELDEAGGRAIPATEALRLRLNEPDRQAEYATSVLLTNTFLLAPSERPGAITEAADDLFFASLSELVSTRLNLFLNQALGAENLDVAVGVQQRAGLQDLDLTYGVALRLLDERLVIRGEGVYQQLEDRPLSEALHGEVVVEVRVSEGVSVEFFYRREGDLLLSTGIAGATTGAYGAGVNYQAEFVNWSALVRRILAIEPRREDEAEPTSAALPPR